MIEHDFHWLPLLVLLIWIIACAFMWLNSAKGRAPDRGTSEIERSRAFARNFKQVPAWHKRELERIIQQACHEGRGHNWPMLERHARHIAFRNGVALAGPRERFIVACLWFFDRSEELRMEWPELYEHMSLITGRDPVRMRQLRMRPQPV